MKKLTITMIFMLTLITPTLADFTLADLFVSGGTTQQPSIQSEDEEVRIHDCD